MRKSFLVLILLVVVLSGYFLYKQNGTRFYDRERKVNLARFDFQNWHEYTAPSGRFRVFFPILPQHTTERVSDPKTEEIKQYEMYVAEREDGTIFMISTITYPEMPSDANPEEFLKSVMDSMRQFNEKNEIKKQNFGEYKGYPSLDFCLENKEIMIDTKTFLVKKTLYVLSRVVKQDDYNPYEFEFFVNSFELIPSFREDMS